MTQAALPIVKEIEDKIVHGFKIELTYTRSASGKEDIKVTTTGGSVIEWSGALHQAIRILTERRTLGGDE